MKKQARKKLQTKKQDKRDPEMTRQKLMQAGIQHFSAYGFHGACIDKIVKSAEVNKRMLYYYFDNKEKFFGTVLSEVFSRLEAMELEVLQQTEDLEQGLRLLFEQSMKFLSKQPEFIQLMMWENINQGQFLKQHPQLLTKSPILNELKRLVQNSRQKMLLKEEINIEHLLIQFYSVCFFYHSNQYTMSHTVGMDLTQEAMRRKGIQQAVEILIRGLVRNPRGRVLT